MSNKKNIIGNWKSVEDGMPDDDITCLVWSSFHADAIIAYHDSAVLEKRQLDGKRVCSGWVSWRGRVIPGVTHYCDDISAPQ